MKSYEHSTLEEVYNRAQEAIGIPFKDIAADNQPLTDKGAVGKFIEKNWFGIEPNSRSAPDFIKAGIELKVMPYIQKEGKIRAKERLTCNKIDFMNEIKNTFETSSFWEKCRYMLIMTYEYIEGISKGNYFIDHVFFFPYTHTDLDIIKCDYYTIINKIKNGQAHLLSERDTIYLAASTKGRNKKEMKYQPKSTILAKSRAFSLKKSYVTEILNKVFFKKHAEELLVSFDDLGFRHPCIYNGNKDFLTFDNVESRILERLFWSFEPSLQQIKQLSIKLDKSLHDTLYILISKRLGVNDIVNSDVFSKAGFSFCIIIEKNGKSMPKYYSNKKHINRILYVIIEISFNYQLVWKKSIFLIPVKEEQKHGMD